MMAEVTERLLPRDSWTTAKSPPDLLVIDGGKGQLGAARAVLAELGALDDVDTFGTRQARGGDLSPGPPRADLAAAPLAGPPARPAHPERGASVRRVVPPHAALEADDRLRAGRRAGHRAQAPRRAPPSFPLGRTDPQDARRRDRQGAGLLDGPRRAREGGLGCRGAQPDESAGVTPAELPRRIKAEALRPGVRSRRGGARRSASRKPIARGVARRAGDTARCAGWRAGARSAVDPRLLVEGCRSIVSVGLVYHQPDRDAAPADGHAGRVVRLGRGLPPRAQGQAPRAARARPRDRPVVRGPGVHRLGSRHGALLGRAGGARAGAARTRSCSTSGWARSCSWASSWSARSSSRMRRGRPLRDVHAVPRRLPHGRVRGPVSARRPPLHQLLDDRAQGGDPRRSRRPPRRLGSSAATSARTSARGTAPRRTTARAASRASRRARGRHRSTTPERSPRRSSRAVRRHRRSSARGGAGSSGTRRSWPEHRARLDAALEAAAADADPGGRRRRAAGARAPAQPRLPASTLGSGVEAVVSSIA